VTLKPEREELRSYLKKDTGLSALSAYSLCLDSDAIFLLVVIPSRTFYNMLKPMVEVKSSGKSRAYQSYLICRENSRSGLTIRVSHCLLVYQRSGSQIPYKIFVPKEAYRISNLRMMFVVVLHVGYLD
jgi:hypothetical protein